MTTHHQARRRHRRGSYSAARAGVRLRNLGPGDSTGDPGSLGAAGTGRRPRQARGDDEHAQDHARHRGGRHEDDDLRRRTAAEQGRHAHVEHRNRRLGARRAPRQRRLPRPQDDEVRRPAGQGADRRDRCVQRHARRSARLRRPARHLRRRRRHPGREGRLPDRPPRDDDTRRRARSARRSRSRTPASAPRSTRARSRSTTTTSSPDS